MRDELPADTRLRSADLLAALSLVTDLGMGNPPEAAMRGCLLATALARRLGVDEHTTADVYYTTLLRYVGCTAPAHEQAFLGGGDDINLRSARARIDSGRPREALGFVFSQMSHGRSPLEPLEFKFVGDPAPPCSRAKATVTRCQQRPNGPIDRSLLNSRGYQSGNVLQSELTYCLFA